MRLIEQIEHSKFKVAIHEYNNKYLLNVTLDNYEQTFKINQDDVDGVNDIKSKLDDEFYLSCMKRFLTMRSDWTNILIKK
jgi:hypothetical protein